MAEPRKTPDVPRQTVPPRTRTSSERQLAARPRLGEMLMASGLLSQAQLNQALSMAQRTGERLGEVLVRARFVRPEQIAEVLAAQFGVAFLPPSQIGRGLVDREAIKTFGLKLFQENHVLPVIHRGQAHLLLSDPLDTQASDRVELQLGKRPYLITTPSDIDMILQVLAFETVDANRIIESARESIEQGEVQALLDYILGRAVLERASDVHLEPSGATTVVRYRLDGELSSVLSLPRQRHENLANVLFARAGVDLSDFNRLHDGRFSFKFAGRNLDVRFACSPTVEGPMIVLRILDDTRSLATLEELGYNAVNLRGINHLLRFPYGLILVVGPTGSGKTTTLYSCLSRINDGATKILTIEDPVEIRLPSIQQVQVNDKAGVTFARSIRAFLRQDPDVILVGEIRDEETAREAFRAANTGHLVLSTLHANSAVEAVGRLLDLNMEPYQVATTVLGTLSQRLLRKLCPRCRVMAPFPTSHFSPEVLEPLLGGGRLKDSVELAQRGPGCVECSGGYVGRTVVAEVLTLDEELKMMVNRRASNEELVHAARRQGYQTMKDNALWLVLRGEVSLADAESTVGPMTEAPATRG